MTAVKLAMDGFGENAQAGKPPAAVGPAARQIILKETIGDKTGYETALKSLLLDEVRDSVVVHDRDGHIIYGNRTAYTDLGYTRDEYLRLNLRDILEEDDGAVFEGRLMERAAGGSKCVESVCRRKDGSRFPVEVNSILVSIEGEDYMLSVARDISWRKKAEGELKRLMAAIEQSASIVVITDLEANITYVNRAFTLATGYGRDEVMGRNPRLLKSGRLPDSEYQRLWRTLTEGGEWRGEFYNRRKNGSFYWEYAVITAVRDEAGRPISYLAVKEDITLRRALEEEREAIIAELQEALDNVKTLKSLIPVCASCKKIRNDQGYWQQVDVYLKEHAGVDVSHGLCLECAQKLYPDFASKGEEPLNGGR